MIDAKTYSLLAKASYTADIDGTEINETQEELNNLYKNFNQINPGWEVLSVNGKYYTSWASGFDGVAYLKQYNMQKTLLNV